MPYLAGICSKDSGNQMDAYMTKLETRLTVLYDEPFWIGLSERVENGKLTVAKHVFGAEGRRDEITAGTSDAARRKEDREKTDQ